MTTEYFSYFPTVSYNGDTLTNLTIRLDFINKIKDNVALFQYVNIVTGQRPEDIAFLYYGDATLYWIVLYMNNIVDPYYGWLLTDNQLYAYALQKYTDINAIHHYVTTSSSPLGAGVITDQYNSFKTSVTNLAYEQAQNESRRKIKVLQSQYIKQVINEYIAELS